MHLLLIEDEIPAFEKLRSYLSVHLDESFSYDWARSNTEIISFLSSERQYDLIFSDIQLLDGISFNAFEQFIIKTPIVFCTAYDSYLFEAFKSNGIAYVLKPYSDQDIQNALNKFNTLFKSGSNTEISSQVFQELREVIDAKKTYKSRLVIKQPKGIEILDTIDIALIEAKGDFCKITTHKNKTYLYSQSLGSLYAKLDPSAFFRINRSEIVHIKFIERLDSHFKNRLIITLTGVKQSVKTSSSTTADFRLWLDT